MANPLTASRRRFLQASGATLAAGMAARALPAWAASTVTYWHHFTSQTEFDGLEQVMDEFAKAFPEVTVQQENIPNAEFMAKFTSAVIAEARADTSMVTSDRLPDMVALNGLVDLTDRIQAWEKFPFFSEAAWSGITIDEKIYGIPAFSFVNWAYYRKDWFDEAGLAPPDTFEDFVEAAVKLTDPAKNRYGFGLRGGDGGQSMLLDVFDSYDALVYEDNTVSIDVPKAVEAVTFYSDLFTKLKVAQPSAPGDSYRQIMEGFRTGQTAMVWHHTGSLTEISDALSEGQFATTLRPAGPAARIARVSYLYNGVMSDRNIEDSWSWISHWGQVDAAISMLQATGYFPATTEVADDERITSNELYNAAVESLAIGTPLPKVVGLAGWMRNSMLPEFQRVLVGSATPEQAVDAMAKNLERTVR